MTHAKPVLVQALTRLIQQQTLRCITCTECLFQQTENVICVLDMVFWTCVLDMEPTDVCGHCRPMQISTKCDQSDGKRLILLPQKCVC